MALNSQTAALYLPGTNVTPTDATQACVTQAFDCSRSDLAGFQFTLAGAVSAALGVALQVSNAQCPPGLFPSKFPRAGSLGSSAWQPPESSWLQATSGNASGGGTNVVSDTLNANGTTALQLYAADLPFLWVRAITAPVGGRGGQLTIDVTIRPPGGW